MTDSKLAEANRIRAELTDRWPALFNAKKGVPLAIGIHDALLEAMPNITSTQLRRVLAHWCNRPHYLAALIPGADRQGLEGVQGMVTEEHAAFAAERLKTLQAQFVEKAKAKREAEKAEQTRQAEAKRKKAEKEAQKAAPAPPPPKPAPATPKPAGPVVVVKKRRTSPPDGL